MRSPERARRPVRKLLILVIAMAMAVSACSEDLEPAFCDEVHRHLDDIRQLQDGANDEPSLMGFGPILAVAARSEQMVIELAELESPVRSELRQIARGFARSADQADLGVQDPLAGLAWALLSGFQHGPAMQTIDDHTEVECGVRVFGV